MGGVPFIAVVTGERHRRETAMVRRTATAAFAGDDVLDVRRRQQRNAVGDVAHEHAGAAGARRGIHADRDRDGRAG